MIRRTSLFFAVATACALTAGAQPQPACPEGHPVTGDIGLSHLLCVGSSCSVNLRTDRGYVHDFSTEPRIRGLEENGPARGKLQEGDILVAVDGALITTREGGRRLANLTPGKPVTLRVRRGAQEMDVTVVPRPGCNMPQLAVLDGGPPGVTRAIRKTPGEPATPPVQTPPELPRLPEPAAPRIDFGMEIECGSCGWRQEPGGGLIFQTIESPRVLSIEEGGAADEAGLRPGDILLKIDGRPFKSPDGAEHLGTLLPNQQVTLEVGRGGSLRTIRIVPRPLVRRSQRF